MQLGTLIRRLEDEADAASALDGLGDLALLAAVQAMGACYDESPGAYVAGAARRFGRLAGDQDWVDLMGAAERNADPARGALERMVRWALARDIREQQGDDPAAGGCACGHGRADDDGHHHDHDHDHDHDHA